MIDGSGRTVVVVGGTGALGHRIVLALVRRGTIVRALVRPGASDEKRATVRAAGAHPVAVDFADATALATACAGAECIVSALSGLGPTIVDLQGRLLDAAVAAGVPRFIPSDFCLDFTKTRPGDNRNLDLRRTFMAHRDRAPIRATSILDGPFADILVGQAPIVLRRYHRILYWGDVDQQLDFTAKDDVADYTADAALDPNTPRLLRIAGDVVSPRDLAAVMTKIDGRAWKPTRAGGIGLLSVLIRVLRGSMPSADATFPPWQGLQYIRDMSTGRGKLSPLENGR